MFVGNSHDSRFDQVLDTIAMEGVDFGINEFTWEVAAQLMQVDPPNYKAIPDELDVLDSTIIMIVVYYKKKKFFRCSYLIRQFYQDKDLMENKGESIVWDKLYREIRTDKPIITLYEVVWDQSLTSGMPGRIDKNQFEAINLLADHPEKDEQAERDSTMQKFNQMESGKSSLHSKC